MKVNLIVSMMQKKVFDEEPLIDDVEVNIINFCSVLDEDIDLGQPNPTNNNTEEHEDIEDEPLEVLDNDVFESFASEKEPRKKLLRSILKPVACSFGEVHTKAFNIGHTFKEKEKIREVIANYSVKERRDLHYVKNDKTRVRVKCRGIVPELTGDNNKGRGNLVLSKKTTCPWVLFISRADEKQVWTVKTYEDCHSCLQTRTMRACSSKFLANNILHQVESNPKIRNGNGAGSGRGMVSQTRTRYLHMCPNPTRYPTGFLSGRPVGAETLPEPDPKPETR
ncbi:unnamed protein product [Lactuca saligna]|uniref:Transposase MuDR plant domain-containing protein n=1 Tax=Lactuca saligna TaxID=75948 RepID=A0AA35YE04_LACSI|nr:unnamed protein product [Lactuca saligna]